MIWQKHAKTAIEIIKELPERKQRALFISELVFLEDCFNKLFDKISPLDVADLSTAIAMIRINIDLFPEDEL